MASGGELGRSETSKRCSGRRGGARVRAVVVEEEEEEAGFLAPRGVEVGEEGAWLLRCRGRKRRAVVGVPSSAYLGHGDGGS